MRKQLHTEAPFQLSHLMADGRLRDRQFLGGGPERQVPCRGVEGAQRGEGREAGHEGRIHEQSSSNDERVSLVDRVAAPQTDDTQVVSLGPEVST